MCRVMSQQPHQHELVVAVELGPDHDSVVVCGIVQPLFIAFETAQHRLVLKRWVARVGVAID